MENEFVRVFNFEQHQMLLIKQNTEMAEPRMEYITEHEGIRATIGLNFDDAEKRDTAFSNATDENAKSILDSVIRRFS